MKVYLICGILFGAFCTVEPDALIDKLYLIVKDAGLNYTLDQVTKYSMMFYRLMHAINDRAHLNLDDKIIKLKNGLLNLPDDDLRGIKFHEVGMMYRFDMVDRMRRNVSLGWEDDAVSFSSTLMDVLRNNPRVRVIDANARKFLNITRVQLTQQICEVYAKYIQEDIPDDPFRATEPLLDALEDNDSNGAVSYYRDLLQMRVTPTKQTTPGSPGNLPPHFGTSPTQYRL
ncbi:unnamed protein product [Bursaphelenchus xylophilus]|uniref:(pine wood nematode) hypothetical protein n=1 Tax=Bursaphelenchus xylophilus TaxID=6326 RepID=A0A1I7SCW3_BURXY|nr:unnamed protein product [Bursaphelenchus xylophilus]CAG9093364.1 unnamed protein product [Bursaphelenchus xylophilus]